MPRTTDGIQGLCDTTDTDLAIAPGVGPVPVNAASPFGAQVWFTVPAATDEEAPVPVTCDHIPGSMFGLGQTTVTCSATDSDDAPSTVSTTLTVSVLPVAPAPPVIDSATAGNASANVVFEPRVGRRQPDHEVHRVVRVDGRWQVCGGDGSAEPARGAGPVEQPHLQVRGDRNELRRNEPALTPVEHDPARSLRDVFHRADL